MNSNCEAEGIRANPIPKSCSVLIFHQMQEEEAKKRDERIKKNAELSYQKASLPPRMEMHQKKMQQEPPKQQMAGSYSFQPVINELVTREQFERKQTQFSKTLDKKKAMKQTTVPRSPKFTKTASRGVRRDYMNEQTPHNFTSAKNKTSGIPKPDDTVNPSTTKAT